jgi:hypothetical protein
MAEFLLELYVSRTNGVAVERGEKRARIAAEELTEDGTPIRFLRSIFLPEDETCFYLYEAETVEAVREAASRAELTFDRVTEAVAGVASPPQPQEASALVRQSNLSRGDAGRLQRGRKEACTDESS